MNAAISIYGYINNDRVFCPRCFNMACLREWDSKIIRWHDFDSYPEGVKCCCCDEWVVHPQDEPKQERCNCYLHSLPEIGWDIFDRIYEKLFCKGGW